jgi:hypothetical protein
MEHSGTTRTHQHITGDHSHAGAQAVAAALGHNGTTSQVWTGLAVADRHFALYQALERPPRA